MAQKHDILYTEKPMTVGTHEQGPQKRYRRLRFPSFDADVWAEKNPLLQKGELGHEKDTGRFKVGDGVTYWSDLPYNSVGESAKVNGHNVLEIVAGENIDLKQNGNVLTIGALGFGYSKDEIDNKVVALNAGIDANAVAIQKTRDDYMSADADIMTIVNNHAEELTTLRGNQASLGDQVSGIEEKIPESASGSNPLITKQQLLDEEMDIRDDLNEMASELQTQITAQAAEIATKQDQLIAGDNITIVGNVISATGGGGGGGGIANVVHDRTLKGNGTSSDPLGLSSETITRFEDIEKVIPGTANEDNKLCTYEEMLDNVQVVSDELTGLRESIQTKDLTVGTSEGTLNLSITAGVATIATNNGLDIVSQTKFDTAPTTDDATTWENANDTSLVTKRQVATALSESGDCGLIIRRL